MSHTVEILAVGTELLLGSIANTDAQMISRRLSELGLNVYYHTVVGDNLQRVIDAVNIARSRADILITTGGLGPTCDDMTKQALARAFGLKLEFRPECEERCRWYYTHKLHGRAMPENNLQQCWLPEGSDVLENDWGTAPGCTFEKEGVRVFMLPGVPSECEPMMEHRVMPILASLQEGIILSRTLKIYGKGESEVELLLRDKMNAMTNPTLAPYAKAGQVELRITAKGKDEATCRAMLDPVEEEVRAVLGDIIYGVDVDSLEARAVELLKERGKMLALAESCTGGWLGKRITDITGASQVFRGGVVAYTNDVKANLLGVPCDLLEKYGAVSPEVAKAMAEGVRNALGADLALSVTGLAGPESDEFGHPGGTVYLALTDGEQTWVKETNRGTDRTRVRLVSGHCGLDMLRRYLTGCPVL